MEAGFLAPFPALGYNPPALDDTAGFPPPRAPSGRAAFAGAVVVLCLAAWAAGCAGGAGRTLPAAARALGAGDPDRAEALYRAALEAEGATPEARAEAGGNLGVALGRQGRWEEAAEALEAAAALAPRSADLNFDLGVAYRHLGRYEDARARYEAAARLAPDDMDIAYNLGILYEVYLNDPDRALAAYRRYLAGAAAGGSPEATRVRAWVEAIERRMRPEGGGAP